MKNKQNGLLTSSFDIQSAQGITCISGTMYHARDLRFIGPTLYHQNVISVVLEKILQPRRIRKSEHKNVQDVMISNLLYNLLFNFQKNDIRTLMTL